MSKAGELAFTSMSRVVKRSASQPVKAGRSRPLPQFVPPQLSQLAEKPSSGPQWLHETKLDGYRMAAGIDNGRVQPRTGLDWTDKYPSAIVALADLKAKTAYLDGELCGVDDAGLPSFAHTQAATDGERSARLVYYAFDLLHLNGRAAFDRLCAAGGSARLPGRQSTAAHFQN
jgi:ATP-dependent DNA ligase